LYRSLNRPKKTPSVFSQIYRSFVNLLQEALGQNLEDGKHAVGSSGVNVAISDTRKRTSLDQPKEFIPRKVRSNSVSIDIKTESSESYSPVTVRVNSSAPAHISLSPLPASPVRGTAPSHHYDPVSQANGLTRVFFYQRALFFRRFFVVERFFWVDFFLGRMLSTV